MSDQWPTISDIRARASDGVTEICANPREYFRLQSILRDRKALLHYYDAQAINTRRVNELLSRALDVLCANEKALNQCGDMGLCECCDPALRDEIREFLAPRTPPKSGNAT